MATQPPGYPPRPGQPPVDPPQPATAEQPVEEVPVPQTPTAVPDENTEL